MIMFGAAIAVVAALAGGLEVRKRGPNRIDIAAARRGVEALRSCEEDLGGAREALGIRPDFLLGPGARGSLRTGPGREPAGKPLRSLKKPRILGASDGLQKTSRSLVARTMPVKQERA